MFPTAYVGKEHPRWTGLRSRVGWGVVTLRFSFIFLSFVLILMQDEIWIVRWGDGREENSDGRYREARGGSEVPEGRAGYFPSPQKVG